MEPSFIWSGSTTRPDSNNIAWFLMGDLLRLSPWSWGLGREAQVGVLMDKPLGGPGATPRENFFGPFLYWNRLWVIRVLLWVVLPCFRVRENIVAASCTLYSSLIIVKSLQLCGCRQIAEPRKYCLVCVIVFLWRVFSLFFVSHRLEILS